MIEPVRDTANVEADHKRAPRDLGAFKRVPIEGNRSFAWRSVWYLLNALFFQGAILGLIPYRAKAMLLRAFGASVGSGFVCKPRVSIKYPWFLELGDNVWLGEMVWIDNFCRVTIGSNVCISQGSYLFTGSHDWSDPGFAAFFAPIEIGEGVWVTAFQRIGPGRKIAPQTIVADSGGTGHQP
jgi:putative colanic acid biosynthesis acetyltransferase WcaF